MNQNTTSGFIGLLSAGAVIMNILFVMWILYNGINEDFQGTPIEKGSYLALMLLLATNTFLLLRKSKVPK